MESQVEIRCSFCDKTHDISFACKEVLKAMDDSYKQYKKRFGNKNVFQAIEQVLEEYKAEKHMSMN